jgi:flagellar protein FlgJ
MIDISGVGSPAAAADTSEARQRLRQAVRQLEGIFVQQLFQAMRETVPKDGITDGGAGEQMFTGMLDERLAGLVPAQWDHDGLSDAILRQLQPHAAADDAAAHAPAAPTRP